MKPKYLSSLWAWAVSTLICLDDKYLNTTIEHEMETSLNVTKMCHHHKLQRLTFTQSFTKAQRMIWLFTNYVASRICHILMLLGKKFLSSFQSIWDGVCDFFTSGNCIFLIFLLLSIDNKITTVDFVLERKDTKFYIMH